MGWNQGYTVCEATVVGAYDLGKLDKALLGVLLEPYRDSDIDSGGATNRRTHDGKSFEQVVIEVWGLEAPVRPAGRYDENPDAWDDYHEALYVQFKAVTENFGW